MSTMIDLKREEVELFKALLVAEQRNLRSDVEMAPFPANLSQPERAMHALQENADTLDKLDKHLVDTDREAPWGRHA